MTPQRLAEPYIGQHVPGAGASIPNSVVATYRGAGRPRRRLVCGETAQAFDVRAVANRGEVADH